MSLLDRPVFVVATPGVDTSEVLRALGAALGLEHLQVDGDAFEDVPRLRPANRGWDSARLGRQDAKATVVAEVERAWRERLATPGPSPRILVGYAASALHVRFLATAWPDARFIQVRRDADACRETMRAAWESGTAVAHPDLPGWTGPAWSLVLTPGWRTLRGRRVPEIVDDQWEKAAGILEADLASLPPGTWTSVTQDSLDHDLAAEVERLVRFLATPPTVTTPGTAGPSPYRSTSTPNFAELLDKLGSSLLVTTYQSDRVVIARALDGRLNTHFRELPSPMGIAYRPGLLSIGTKGEVQTFADVPRLTEALAPAGRHDACFVPRSTQVTGDIRVHDVAWAGDELWAVATRFSCLVTFDGRHSFVPRWAPKFITALAPEDRCHLNGLAVVDGRVKYVTALGTGDTPGGWRSTKARGGIVMDVETDEVVVSGLSMPHSPRWYRDRLWVLESGEGTLSRVDVATGTVETVAQLPGFTRGLAFAGRYAFVGLSEVREATTFGGLPLTARLEDRQCGVWIVDVETGQTMGFLRFEDAVQEIFDVALLPGLRFPELLEAGSPDALDAYVLPS